MVLFFKSISDHCKAAASPFINKHNQRNEFLKAKKRMLRLLKYTQNMFTEELIGEYRKPYVLSNNFSLAKLIATNTNLIYDDRWPDYIPSLDKFLDDKKVNDIIKWLRSIDAFLIRVEQEFAMIVPSNRKIIYDEILHELSKLSPEIETTIKSLET
ncbi:hypothetical protein [Bacillus atrophaeus]|uniref:hypothetical protein n=1 Tax=Bacillus atrophaeus TaxID=1452 RepID=UPI0007795687|nr:hypothetical protein [Bacillus atrophaeus]